MIFNNKFILLSATFIWMILCSGIAQGLECRSLLSNNNTLIHFYEDMLIRGSITLEDLRLAKDSLEKGEQLPNPFLNRDNQRNSALKLIRNENFIKAIDKGYSAATLLNWFEFEIVKLQKEGEERARASDRTVTVHNKAVFHRISSGSFEYVTEFERYKVELSEPFEMQSTNVSQGQWIDVMGVNPSSHQMLNSTYNMNTPVENITVWSAMEFANRLSILHGYKPVYDLEGFEFSGSPENGDYKLINPDKIKIKVTNPDNDIYKTQGYRLPTLAEFYMVVTDRGRYSRAEDFENSFTGSGRSLEDYFNYDSESSSESGAYKPFSSNDADFYDLLGNVYSFTSDTLYRYDNPPKGLNPSDLNSDIKTDTIRLFGSSYKAIKPQLLSFLDIAPYPVNDRGHIIGFRLVRTLEK